MKKVDSGEVNIKFYLKNSESIINNPQVHTAEDVSKHIQYLAQELVKLRKESISSSSPESKSRSIEVKTRDEIISTKLTKLTSILRQKRDDLDKEVNQLESGYNLLKKIAIHQENVLSEHKKKLETLKPKTEIYKKLQESIKEDKAFVSHDMKVAELARERWRTKKHELDQFPRIPDA